MASKEDEDAEAIRNRLIDEHFQERISGGPDEGASWAAAFRGDQPPDGAPLTEEERTALRDLMVRAAENEDHEALDRLKALAENPADLRKVMANFDPDAK